MDISSLLKTFTSPDAVSGISKASGATSKEVKSVLSAGLPSLLDGALSQSKGKTAESFAGALSEHSGSNLSNIGSFLSGVDMTDGSKIVGHLLGSGKDSTVKEISKSANVSKAKTNNILSAAAPLLMGLLGNEASNSNAQSGSAVSGLLSSLLGSVDVGSLLTGLLGGGDASAEETTTTTSNGKKKPKKDDKKDEKKEESSGGFLSFLTGLFK